MNVYDGRLKPVKMLVPEVARKIAAGEVIDRPCAVLREFLDNAVDAGAGKITAETEAGGINFIRVTDNGCGMTKEDLQLCAKPHATSKITTDGDLEQLTTLGFRGEALASIAAVSRLEIATSRNAEAWHLETGPDGKEFIQPASLPVGTTAVCRGLFDNFPARHRFLKRPQAETLLCKQIFIDKSLPFPDIAFRLICDSKIRFDFPAGQTLTQRFCSALEITDKLPLFYEIHSQNKAVHAQHSMADLPVFQTGIHTESFTAEKQNENRPWNFSIVLGESSVYRSDRKLMYVFVNGRRVQEYALLQALDYGAEGYFPNGTHPAACLFLDIDSSLVDFNIHPAKKEVRFKDIAPIHRSISSAVRNFYRDLTIGTLARDARAGKTMHESDGVSYSEHSVYEPPEYVHRSLHEKNGHKLPYTKHTENLYTRGSLFESDKSFESESAAEKEHYSEYARPGKGVSTAAFFKIGDVPQNDAVDNGKIEYADNVLNGSGIRYIGSALGVFLIAEKDGDLYLVDQHAGHERLLFERFLKTAGEKQALLVPLVIETPSLDDDRYLETLLPELTKAGFTMKNCGSGCWEVETVPVKWQGTERDLQNDLLEKRIAPDEIIRSLAATCSCRAAVKDGHILDPSTASQLLADIFDLKDPHCPHGRPIWTKLTKDELFRAVRRTR